jgi:Lrp/AsnC family leucine-responsive transcriptional regulator
VNGILRCVDAIDRDLIKELEADARLSWRELGDRVGLSANAARDRVRSLLDRGVIAGFHARVRADHSVQAYVDVRLRTPDAANTFEALIKASPIVIEAAHVAGRPDYTVRVACAHTRQLDDLIRAMKERAGVIATETRLILRVVA